MKYFAQVSFTYFDGTFFQLSKSFDSLYLAHSWVAFYLECLDDCNPIYDISEIEVDLDLEDL